MDPVLGAAIVAAIQAIAALAKQAGMSREEADNYFLTTYDTIKTELPGNLPDAK